MSPSKEDYELALTFLVNAPLRQFRYFFCHFGLMMSRNTKLDLMVRLQQRIDLLGETV